MDIVNARVPKLSGGVVERQLTKLEQKYAMGSQYFLTDYNAGSLTDAAASAGWAGLLTAASRATGRHTTA